jgi:hypothetical protein
MATNRDLPDKSLQGKCRIAEIVQYTCNVETFKGSTQLTCFPIPRIFKMSVVWEVKLALKLTDL